jgi:hypothetical protein
VLKSELKRAPAPVELACVRCGQVIPSQFAWSLPGHRGFRCRPCHESLMLDLSRGRVRRISATRAPRN